MMYAMVEAAMEIWNIAQRDETTTTTREPAMIP
jgi:hypothetical protein